MSCKASKAKPAASDYCAVPVSHGEPCLADVNSTLVKTTFYSPRLHAASRLLKYIPQSPSNSRSPPLQHFLFLCVFPAGGLLRAWQIAEIVNLSTFVGARGYPFYIACLYIALILLIADILLSIWVGWSVQNNRLSHAWWVQTQAEAVKVIFYNNNA